MQLPFLRANKEGKVCVSAVEQIKTVLKYFTEICQVRWLHLWREDQLKTINCRARCWEPHRAWQWRRWRLKNHSCTTLSLCFVLFLGGQHQFDLHCAWQIDSHQIKVFDISLSHNDSEVSNNLQTSVDVTPSVKGLTLFVIVPLSSKDLNK